MTAQRPNTAVLVRRVGLPHGVALYISAILGAGVLVLPGQAASIAGPASLVSWGFACLMGLVLAAMFAALARRHPSAGGVAEYVGRAFGPTAGGLCGWMFFAAGSVGQAVVPLTGGYYVAQALDAPRWVAFAVALVVLGLATASNLAGMRLSGRVQLALAAAVGAALAVTIAVAVPAMDGAHLEPFAPHGLPAIGQAVIVLFFAFAGWETVAHLAEEFRDPERDLPRAVGITVGVITVLYLGIAAAVVATGTYGDPATDHVALGLILQDAFGSGAAAAAAVIAVVISLGTTTAFISGISRLGYSLARERWLPGPIAGLTAGGVPAAGVATVAAVALAGLAVAYPAGWGTEQLVVVPSTLVVAVYLFTALAGVRLLRGGPRWCAGAAVVLTLVVVPSALGHALVPAVVIASALAVRLVLGGFRRG